jgi:hypothetical protein
MPKQVFVSHASSDRPAADVFVEDLRRRFGNALKVFQSSDPESLRPGQKWRDQLENHLFAADAVVLLCTPDSLRRPWVAFEVGAAHRSGRPVLPFRAARGKLKLHGHPFDLLLVAPDARTCRIELGRALRLRQAQMILLVGADANLGNILEDDHSVEQHPPGRLTGAALARFDCAILRLPDSDLPSIERAAKRLRRSDAGLPKAAYLQPGEPAGRLPEFGCVVVRSPRALLAWLRTIRQGQAI